MSKFTLIVLPLCLLAFGLQSCAVAEDIPTVAATVTQAATATLTTQPEDTAKPSPTSQTCTVSASDALNLRAGPGTQYTVTHWLKAGEPLTLTPTPARGAWIEVITQQGAQGWVNSNFCK